MVHDADPRRAVEEQRETIIGRAGEAGRLVLGALTLVSPLSLFVAISAGLLTALTAPDSAFWPPVAAVAVIYNVVWTGLLLLFYAPHMLQDPAVDRPSKLAWSVSFVFAAPVALPIYWVLHIRPRHGPWRPEEPSDHPVEPAVHVREIPLRSEHTRADSLTSDVLTSDAE